MSTKVDRYMEIAKRLEGFRFASDEDALDAIAEDRLIEAMDDLWWEMLASEREAVRKRIDVRAKKEKK
ncbi:MAG: hypothetical protein U9Q07_03990 [Planctomycetota bacterium]|nr:hypothetical protein [Planctomycetota bacterium]